MCSLDEAPYFVEHATGRRYYRSVVSKRERYSLGDFVAAWTNDDAEEASGTVLSVGEIIHLFQTEAEPMCEVRWLYSRDECRNKVRIIPAVNLRLSKAALKVCCGVSRKKKKKRRKRLNDSSVM